MFHVEHVYLPIDNVSDFACYSVYDKDTIRAYYTKPAINSSSDYVDFYINSHYLEKNGSQSWGQWSTTLPTCLSETSITNEIEYRTDFFQSLGLFVLLLFVLFWLPLKLTFLRFFRRFK